MFSTALYPHEFHRLVNHFASPCGFSPIPHHSRPRRRFDNRLNRPVNAAHYRLIIPDLEQQQQQQQEAPRHTEIDPRVSLNLDDSSYQIDLEVPGFAKNQINVELTDSKTLQITGTTVPVGETQPRESSSEQVTPETAAPSIEHDEQRLLSPVTQPKRTSVEEVRDESEKDYVEVDSASQPQSPVFSASRTVTPEPVHENQSAPTRPQAPRRESGRSLPTRSFEKTFDIPKDADRDQVQAELKDGILRVRIARIAPKVDRRRITVA